MSNPRCLIVEIEQFTQEVAAWQQAHANSRSAWQSLSETIQSLVVFAKGQGCITASRYHTSILAMIYQALFLLEQPVSEDFRETLTATQNNDLAAAQRIVQRVIQEGMDHGVLHKAIYRLAKKRVSAFATMIGKTKPGDDRVLDRAA
ncbi:MAG: hypothetical protein HQM05_17745 [Magnetococcales bacterium]|nr:hypothetical protein [Magnetococcales bacterium]